MYQIVLFENKKRVKTLYSYNREYDVNNRFQKLKSQEAFFPKTKIYKNKKLIDVKYEILLLKKRTETDNDRIVKNELGKHTQEKIDNPEWVIIDSFHYKMEENFKVSGANRKLTAKEIIDYVVTSNRNKQNLKQILILNNKLIVEGVEIYMVTCKDIEEVIRLYNKIRVYCVDNKISDIIFFGTISKKDRKFWYKKLHNRLGIGYNRLYRSISR
jgi:hypothetical protein